MVVLITSYWSREERLFLVEGKKSALIHGFSNHFQIKKEEHISQAIKQSPLPIALHIFQTLLFQKAPKFHLFSETPFLISLPMLPQI